MGKQNERKVPIYDAFYSKLKEEKKSHKDLFEIKAAFNNAEKKERLHFNVLEATQIFENFRDIFLHRSSIVP